jgi:pilus assembly protein CpaB
VLPAKITGPGARPSVAVQISEGMRGYALKVTDETGVGGNALPGDWVDVIMTRETNPDRPDKGLISQVVVQNVRVLGVDLNADPTSTQTAVRRTATLEVKPDDAQKIALAAQLGSLSLSLRKTGVVEVTDTHLLRAGDVAAPGTRTASSVPVSRAAAPKKTAVALDAVPAPPPPPVTHTITIMNGAAATRVTVPVDRAASGVAG